MFEMSAGLGRDLRLHADESDERVEAEIRAEQARLFCSQTHLMIGLGVAVGAALAVAQWPVIDHGVIAGWLVVLAAVSLLSAILVLHFRRRLRSGEVDHRWIHYGAAFALAHGLVWSAAAFALFPEQVFAHQAILTVMLSGIAAGSITVLSSLSVAGAAFVIPALLPLAYQYALARTTPALLILAMLMVFLLTLMLANRHLYKTLRDNLRLRIEKGLSEAALYESESRYRLMFSQSPLGVIHYDAHANVLDCNDMLVEILDTSRQAIVGTNMISDAGDDEMASAVRTSLQTGWAYYEDTYEAANGVHAVPLRAFFNAVYATDRSVVGGVGIVEDFTQRKRAEEAIHRQAYYDPLTELPNRRLLGDRLEKTLSGAMRHGRFGALIFLDVDYFKRINDWLGHGPGDNVLCTIAGRLVANLRAEDTVARLSGDEFIVLLPQLGGSREVAEHGARAVCDKLQVAVQEPLQIESRELRLTASVGVTIFPSGEATGEELLRRSDTAMYRAKRAVRGEVRFYEPRADEPDDVEAVLDRDLQFALERDQLLLLYQPIVDADDRGVGAEALLRWQHPEQGLVGPDRFIPLAEESGVIIPMGRWTLAEVCRCLNRVPADSPVRLSVNVSAREFHHTGFVRQVEQALEGTGVDGRRLVFEVTENVLIDQLGLTVRKMERLRRLGIGFQVDDFGTGYSSLTYLKRLPVEGVKIDRSFVRDLETDPSDAAIVEAIVAMAGRLDLCVVAEGVERASQRDFLRRLGCDQFQGFYWSRPARFEELFAEHRFAATGEAE